MLTDIACKGAVCPADKPRARLTDSGGLYLEVAPSGSKRWFWKYKFGGKEKRLAVGSYPATGLKDARLARDAARGQLAAGVDPAMERRVAKLTRAAAAADTFEAAARELHRVKAPGWSARYAGLWLLRMEQDLFPWIGSMPVGAVPPQALLGALRRVEQRGAIETAHVLMRTAGQVFAYAVSTGRAERNPATGMAATLKPMLVKHMAAILDPDKLRDLVRAMRQYHGHATTQAALQASVLLFQRPGNIRMMAWADLDLDAALWTIPAEKMKLRKQAKASGPPHLVPLSTQMVALLREQFHLTGSGDYVFPTLYSGSRPMSENTINTALRRMGFGADEMTAHGFRATARTILAERLGVDPEVIEAQLAHAKTGPLGAAYDRAKYLPQRFVMMQTWADFIDALAGQAQ